MLVTLALVAVISACGGADDPSSSPDSSETSARPAAGAATSTTDSAAETPTTPTVAEEFVAEADDFVNLADMTPVRGFFVDNRLGHIDEAVEVAESPTGGVYPVGTVIQLVPQEAMVKRGAGYSPEFADWEFFVLNATTDGTEIVARGSSEVLNSFGGSCAACHALAEVEFDFVCEKDNGCDPLPIGDDMFQMLQQSDPRPITGGS